MVITYSICISQGGQNTGRCGVEWNLCELYLMFCCCNPVECENWSGEVRSSILWQGCSMIVWVLRGCWLSLRSCSTCASAQRKSAQNYSVFLMNRVIQRRLRQLILRDQKIRYCRSCWKMHWNDVCAPPYLFWKREGAQRRNGSHLN